MKKILIVLVILAVGLPICDATTKHSCDATTKHSNTWTPAYQENNDKYCIEFYDLTQKPLGFDKCTVSLYYVCRKKDGYKQVILWVDFYNPQSCIYCLIANKKFVSRHPDFPLRLLAALSRQGYFDKLPEHVKSALPTMCLSDYWKSR